ncbi:MAG: tRNA (N(6)-L-threonylcarbamoyladenosine(37)-C(2))-methylthiotransferase MtaB [Bdellovibrionaceae bacterium]|nr:tRNA (N(6)-L-threonylcarbamoyladenosine(37)-C(2))-methylthiotransferase MtaB [Bdellovibrio sp.]
MDYPELSAPTASAPTSLIPNAKPNARYEFVVHTFGCKVNTYDTGLIQKNLTSHGNIGISDRSLTTAVHVLNTCAVTAEATQQAVRLIRKIKSKQPLATVVVTGCAAQVDTGAFENLPGANLIVANSHKGLLPQLLDQYFKGELKDKVFKSNIFKKEDLEIGGGEELQHTRSFLKIQDGCNSFCTFCIIPYARGQSRSIPIEQLLMKINSLHREGVQEVVLTGVHIGDYEDASYSSCQGLESLIEHVLAKTNIPRIRLSSLEPIELTDRLLALYQNPRLCPHFHMSIQSGDTNVLQQMKRKYTEQNVRSALQAIQSYVPGAHVGMDVIAGFPSETDEQFENTYKILAETPWTRLHVFPYSERQGTRAALLPQLNMAKRKERAARLRELSLHRHQAEALKQVGTTKKALVLNKLSNTTQALSRDYWALDLGLNETQHSHLKNTEIEVVIESVELKQMDVILKARGFSS